MERINYGGCKIVLFCKSIFLLQLAQHFPFFFFLIVVRIFFLCVESRLSLCKVADLLCYSCCRFKILALNFLFPEKNRCKKIVLSFKKQMRVRKRKRSEVRFLADQNRRSAADGSPSLQRFFVVVYSYVPWRSAAETGPAVR